MMYLSRIRLRPKISATQLPLLLKDRKGYGLHRLFWDLLSDGQHDRQKRSFLFREEIASEQLKNPGRRKADPVYYVLSRQLPQSDSPLFEVESQRYEPKLRVCDRLAFKLRVNAVVTRDKKRHDIIMDTQQGWLKEQLQDLGLDHAGHKSDWKRRLLDHAGDPQIKQWRHLVDEGRFKQKLEQKMGRSDLLQWALKTIEATRIEAWWVRQGKERLGFEVAKDQNGDSILEAAAYQKHHLPEKGSRASFNSLDLSGEIIVSNVSRFEKLLMEGTGPAKAFGCGLMMVRRI